MLNLETGDNSILTPVSIRGKFASDDVASLPRMTGSRQPSSFLCPFIFLSAAFPLEASRASEKEWTEK